jgi:hypothetical protein
MINKNYVYETALLFVGESLGNLLCPNRERVALTVQLPDLLIDRGVVLNGEKGTYSETENQSEKILHCDELLFEIGNGGISRILKESFCLGSF